MQLNFACGRAYGKGNPGFHDILGGVFSVVYAEIVMV